MHTLIGADISTASVMRIAGSEEETFLPGEGVGLKRLIDSNPWYHDHFAEMRGFILEYAEFIRDKEEKFYEERGEYLDRRPQSYVPEHRLEMLYRNALGEMKQVSEQVQLMDPIINSAFPFAQYITLLDERVRPTHAVMHGFVALRTWEGWPVIRPKNGYNCRCTLIYRDWSTAITRGWAVGIGEPKREVFWPNTSARLNYESAIFPDLGWEGPKLWVA